MSNTRDMWDVPKRSPGPYKCKKCRKVGNYRIFVSADRYFPNATGGSFVSHTDDANQEAFCGFNCLLAYYAHHA